LTNDLGPEMDYSFDMIGDHRRHLVKRECIDMLDVNTEVMRSRLEESNLRKIF